MITKKEEIRMYTEMYIFAFGKERSFFHETEPSILYNFLCENYWGDSLMLRMKLLVNLLSCDSDIQPAKIRDKLVKKSEELNKYLNRLRESDLPA